MSEIQVNLVSLLIVFIVVGSTAVVMLVKRSLHEHALKKLFDYRFYKIASRSFEEVENDESLLLHDERSKFERNLEAILKVRLAPSSKFQLSIQLKQAGIAFDPNTFVSMFILIGSVLSFLLIWDLEILSWYSFPVVAIFFALIPAVLYLKIRKSMRLNKFLAAFPSALDMMVRTVRAGHSVEKALDMVAHEIEEPVGGIFKELSYRTQLGTPLDMALLEMTQSVPLTDFRFLAIVLILQKETGGSLAESLTNLSNLIRKRAEIKMKIQALASEGKTSVAIVGSLPFLGAGFLSVTRPGYIDSFFSDSSSQMLLIIAAGLIITGIAITFRIIKFDI